MEAKERRDFLIGEFAEFPDWVVNAAYIYARNLTDYGVDARKTWENVTQMREDLNRAYFQGRYDESERWRKVIKRRNGDEATNKLPELWRTDKGLRVLRILPHADRLSDADGRTQAGHKETDLSEAVAD